MNNKKRPMSQTTNHRMSNSLNQKGNIKVKNKNLKKEKTPKVINIKLYQERNKSQKKINNNNNVIKESPNNIKVINHNKDEKNNGNSDNLYDI